jgi:hypothetical protein
VHRRGAISASKKKEAILSTITTKTSTGEDVTLKFAENAGSGKGKSFLPEVAQPIPQATMDAILANVSIKDGDASTLPLKAYQVGDFDIVAAFTPEGAIEILCEQFGYPREDYTLDEVQVVADKHLDSLEVYNQDEGKTEKLKTSLRQDIEALNAPAYMYGWE